MRRSIFLCSVLFVFLVGLSGSVLAMPILTGQGSGLIWTASDSDGRSAEAVFLLGYDGANHYSLTLTLTNTSVKSGQYQPNEALMGVFFDIAFSDNSTFTLNTPDVQVAADSRLYDGNGTRTETNLNGEYGWLADINAYNGGLGYYGISGSSFDAEEGAPAGWEDNGQFSTPIDPYASFPRGESPPAPNGADFGLLGSGGSGLPNGDEFYVTTSILISWDLGEWNSSPSMEIGQINFLYGTEYASTPVPEPATMFLLGTGLIGLAGVGRRFRKKG